MQPENNEFQPQTNNTPAPQPQPWQANTPESPTQPDTQPQTPQQPQPLATPVAPQQPEQPQQPQTSSQPVQPQQPAFAPQAPTPRPTSEDPGKLFSILGIVGAFIMLQLPGLILSIIGYKKSKKTGHRTTLGTVGIWLNAIGLVLSTVALALVVWVAYVGVQQRATDQNTVSNAQTVLKRAEIYQLENNHYPTMDELRNATGEAALSDEEKSALKDTATPSQNEIGYQACTDEAGTVTGADIYAFSVSEYQVVSIGTAGSCETSSFSTFEQ